ncbi:MULTISPECIES: sensor histidine kinase [Streptosporangium]|uniref:histidine kinase n=1 Tax=Streptosporangium brasiliense TaxID=47480 RepID=A0ABT9R2H7_9ACTN|nr:nitrate- and nitrite sensing domain-containing protein [Streptosporangium brasiliense]MDP9863433.1 signal transduction histidine kinase [Streptosporangium brasiliense]
MPIVSLVAIWAFAATLTLRSGQDLLRASEGYERGILPTRTVTTALQHERLLSLAALGDSAVPRTDLDAQRIQTNTARAELERLVPALQESTTPAVWDRLVRLLATMERLTEVRSGVDTHTAGRMQTLDAYSGMIQAAFEVYDKIRISSDIDLNDQTRAVVLMGRSREMLSRQAALIAGAVAEGSMSAEERAAFSELATGRRLLYSLGFDQFDEEFQGLYRDLQSSAAYTSFERIEKAVTTAARPEPSWVTVSAELSDTFDGLGGQVSRGITERSGPLATGILVQIGIAGGLGLIAVAVSIFVSVRFGRRIGTELIGLQQAALDLAHKRLPDVVERLRKGEDVCSEARELNYGTTTEIVNVGKAFSSVQRTAVEAAAGQAQMRKSVNKVFVNLARRSQSLLHRQLSMLETMERRASDPETLEDLFGLDHLTTRMRRHSEGLIILSGAVPGRGWRTPVAIYDVVRAAVEEVEDYQRVTVNVPQGPSVVGSVVTDVIHLVAELVENAAIFSPPHTTVSVHGEAVARGYVIEVEDRGLGITPAEMAQLNERLADPPEFDLADSDRLGLFVVTQLAARHGIRVSLRPSPFGGTTAIVLLPGELVVDATGPRAAYTAEVEWITTDSGLPKRVRQAAPERQAVPARRPVPVEAPEPAPSSVMTSFRDGWRRAEQESGAE